MIRLDANSDAQFCLFYRVQTSLEYLNRKRDGTNSLAFCIANKP